MHFAFNKVKNAFSNNYAYFDDFVYNCQEIFIIF